MAALGNEWIDQLIHASNSTSTSYLPLTTNSWGLCFYLHEDTGLGKASESEGGASPGNNFLVLSNHDAG